MKSGRQARQGGQAGQGRAAVIAVVALVLGTTTWSVVAGGQAPPQGAVAPGQVQIPAVSEVPGTGLIRGRVLSAETGAPLRRAHVRSSGAGLPFRVIATDEQGRYELKDLPAGRYMLQGSKAGYVTVSYGQRRLSDAPKPVDVSDKAMLEGVDLRLIKGGVIVAQVTDEFGEPLPGVEVNAEQYRYSGGVRRLTTVSQGGGIRPVTDDRGQRRLFGLAPGEYFVTAGSSFFGGVELAGAEGTMAYAPTFYPGTTSVASAQRVTLAAGQELRVTFPVSLMRTFRIGGSVRRPDGSVPPAMQGTLRKPLDASGGVSTTGVTIRPDGSFSKNNVMPGDYFIDVSTGAGGIGSVSNEYASLPISVSADLTGIVVPILTTSVATGKFTFDGGTPADLKPGSLQIVPAGTVLGLRPQPRVSADWTFELTGLRGSLLIRVPTPPAGSWFLKAVMLDGKDVTDTPIDFDKLKDVKGLELVMTQKRTTLSGTAAAAGGGVAQDYVAVVFPEDRELRRPQSRFIAAGVSDQTGRFTIIGLPPGRYLAAAVALLERGEEQDPEVLSRLETGATRLTLSDGEARTLTLRVQER